MNLLSKINFFSGGKGDKDKASPCVPYSPEVNKKTRRDYNNAFYYNYYRLLEKKSESTTRGCFGLVSTSYQSTSFQLKEFNIESEMTDSCISSVFTQSYTNSLTSPVEAKYVLPLPPYASVSNFVVEYDGKVLKGKIKEKEKAANKYSDAIASGGQAFLGEKTSDGYFSLQIGNIPPAKDVVVRITIISEIGAHLDSLHYCLHRYMFPKTNFSMNYKLNVALSVPIHDIEIENYSPKIEYHDESKKTATITFNKSNGIDKNIIAIVVPEPSEKPESFIELDPSDKSYAVGINFYPNFRIAADEVDQKSEFIFLIDCSGSMSGGPIKKAKVALEIIMRSLTESCKFNIYCFGSSFKKLFDRSRIYDDESLETASSYINSIDANLGGTELFPPVRDILSAQADSEYPRQVFILTDGEISERDKLIDYVGKEADTTRIFTLGIGSGVDRELVVGLSKSCKGFFELIDDNKDMEAKVMSLVNIAMEPTLSHIKVNWGELKVKQAPETIRPIFFNERMMIYGLLESEPNTEKPHSITITGNGPSGRELSYTLDLDFSKASSNSSNIHTLAAFKIIFDLEQREAKKKEKHDEEIIKLGKKYGLVSTKTSYVVTVESEETTTDAMVAVDVLKPVETNTTSVLPHTPYPLQQQQNYPIAPNTRSAPLRGAYMPTVAPAPYQSFSSAPCPPPPAPGGAPPSFSSISQLSSRSSSLTNTLCKSSFADAPMAAPMAIDPYSVSSGSDDDFDEEEENDCDESLAVDWCADVQMCEVEEQIECKKSIPIAPVLSRKQSSDKDCKKKKEKDSSSKLSKKSSAPPPPPAMRNISSVPTPPPMGQSKPLSLAPKATTGDLCLDLIKLQKANGSWTTSSINQFKFSAKPSSLDSVSDDVWTTLVVIAKFMKSFSDKSSNWDLVVQKASKWIKSQLNKANITVDYNTLLDNAKSAL
ncbi:hypothetical protein CYY_009290 [Polysphondylium violaceum]|uniref:Type A von Willebrand factor domain-containing protein n=1 Tax=Polysphondylium violaceum TaxID=133409 RepID=A0A8J4V0L7_9MYCE|nr:hypothetical protein CYY_009290 [Polysphondylium violaceum]